MPRAIWEKVRNGTSLPESLVGRDSHSCIVHLSKHLLSLLSSRDIKMDRMRSLTSKCDDGVSCSQMCGALHFEADNDGQLPKIVKVVRSVGNGVSVGDTMETN